MRGGRSQAQLHQRRVIRNFLHSARMQEEPMVRRTRLLTGGLSRRTDGHEHSLVLNAKMLSKCDALPASLF